jgi:hypothetical protein
MVVACLLLAVSAEVTGGATASATASAAAPSVGTTGAALTFSAAAASVMDPLGAPEGPGLVSPLEGSEPPGTPGEGVFWLTMAAPGTSWSSALNTSVVVDLSIDGGPAQQIVLFDGSTPFTYTGFTGPLTVGPHAVAVGIDRTLSHVATTSPRLVLSHFTLGVVPRVSWEYAEVARAPVLYGRQSSAHAYTPLLTSVADTTGASASQDLAYVVVISAHDQGDSIVPAYQWGLWGRMTDMVTILNETITPAGTVAQATYASCGCESLPFFPDSVMAPEETTAPVLSAPYFTHPVLRDASATNYLSDRGTTPFRLQELPVAAPPPGQLRDAVMDEHPWTYEVSNEELPREHVISTDPDDLLVGDYRQYAIVDSDLSVSGTVAVEFSIRLSGDPTWYSTDYQQMTAGVPSTFTFNNGGHTRSAVKLPLGWLRRRVVGFRIRLEVPPGAKAVATVAVHSLDLLAVTPQWSVLAVPLPPISVVTGTSLDPAPLPS